MHHKINMKRTKLWTAELAINQRPYLYFYNTQQPLVTNLNKLTSSSSFCNEDSLILHCRKKATRFFALGPVGKLFVLFPQPRSYQFESTLCISYKKHDKLSANHNTESWLALKMKTFMSCYQFNKTLLLFIFFQFSKRLSSLPSRWACYQTSNHFLLTILMALFITSETF